MSDVDVHPDDADAVRVAVAPDSRLVKDEVETQSFRQYIRRAHAGRVAVGDEWDEFVNAGCGSRTEVTIGVAAVEGGTRIGPETRFEID